MGKDDVGLAHKLLSRQGKILVKRNLAAGDAVKLGPDGIKAVRNIGKYQVPVKKALKAEGENLVGAVAGKDPVCGQTIGLADGGSQRVAFRLWVKPQQSWVKALEHLPHAGRGRIGIFVGIQLDQIGQLGLLPRHIGGDGGGPPAPVFLIHRTWPSLYFMMD